MCKRIKREAHHYRRSQCERSADVKALQQRRHRGPICSKAGRGTKIENVYLRGYTKVKGMLVELFKEKIGGNK